MRRCTLLACIGASLAALCVPVVMKMPVVVVYNPSDSVSRGWYLVGGTGHAASIHVGSIVLARIPGDAAELASQRGYLPAGVPVLKRVGAMASQSVCVREHVVRIDDTAVATVRTLDGKQRPLPAWEQCRVLADGELFLLGVTHPASFDSRYFGPIATSAVLGIARPLWTWRAP